MSRVSHGARLNNLFTQLGISTGNHGPHEFDAWFNSDSEEFFTWLLTNITTDNVLTGQEQEAYERLCEEDLVVPSDEYEEAIQEIEDDFPGIFNVEENQFEIQCLNDDISICKEDLKNLEKVLSSAEECTEHLKTKLVLKENENVSTKIEEENASQQCLKLSKDLENVNLQLEEQLIKYLNQLINFNEINNYQTEDHMKYFHDINGIILGIFDEENKANQDVTLLPTEIDDALEEMQNRISNSIYNGLLSKSKIERLQAEIDYLNNLNLPEASTNSLQGTYLYEMEATIISKREKLNSLSKELRQLASKEAAKFVNLSKVNEIETEISNTNEKIGYLETLNGKYRMILAYQILLMMLYDQENFNVKKTEEFFKDILAYINHNLQEIKTRTVILEEVLKDQREFSARPLEHRYKFIENYLTFITGSLQPATDIKSALEISNKFRNDFAMAQQKIFADNQRFKLDCKIIEENVSVLREFLVSGPTLEITLIPYCLYDVFNQVCEALELQENQVKTYASMPKSTQKKLASQKWLNIRRQLWMYFIISPKKVLLYLDQIKIELKKQTKQTY